MVRTIRCTVLSVFVTVVEQKLTGMFVWLALAGLSWRWVAMLAWRMNEPWRKSNVSSSQLSECLFIYLESKLSAYLRGFMQIWDKISCLYYKLQPISFLKARHCSRSKLPSHVYCQKCASSVRYWGCEVNVVHSDSFKFFTNRMLKSHTHLKLAVYDLDGFIHFILL